MKILLTVPSLGRSFGGPVVKASSLAQSMRRLGHSVDIIGCGEGDREGVIALKSAFRFHSTPVPISMGPIKSAVMRSDVVHVIGFRDPVGTAAAYFAHRVRVPYVFEPAGMHRSRIRSHTLKSVFDARIGRRIVANARAVIATSNLEKAELVADGVQGLRVFVRPNGLDLAEHRAKGNGIRQRLGIPAQVPLVFHLGRISKKKGLLPLIRAVRSMEQVWLLIAGPDDGDGTLQAIRREAQRVGERVVIEPQGLWDGEKWAAYTEADVFCLYSESENFGNAAAEAAAAGTPVIVSDACGVADWLEPAASKLIPFGTDSLLKCALSEILSEASYKSAAVESAPRLRESLDWNRIALLQMHIYDSMLRIQATT